MSGIYDKIDKRRKEAPRRLSDGLERALPICRDSSQYPSGCTVLECQFEADRPVARIVQVPADIAATARKPSSDSFLRMTPRREDVKQRIDSSDICSQKQMTDKFVLLPAFCTLKSQDPIDDAARAGKMKVPVQVVAPAILEIDKSEKQLDTSTFKVLTCSSSKNYLRAPYRNEKSPKPMTFIECTTTPKGPLARITQCSSKATEEGINYYIHLGSKLGKKDSSRKISQPVTDPAKRIIAAKKTSSSKRILSGQGIPCQDSKLEGTPRSPPDRECSGKADLKIDISLHPKMKDPLSQITRKNGLEDPSSLKKVSRTSKRRIGPSSCQPIQPAKDIYSDFLYIKSSTPDAVSLPIEICMTRKRLDDQQLQRLTSEQMLRTKRIDSKKSDKVSPCQRSAVASGRACLIPERVSEDTSLSSHELLASYKNHIPAYQLERYEACRTKRNGLQDECIPPFLRTILKKEEFKRTSDKCTERKQTVDKLEQSEMTIKIKVDR
ncbi:uncharacterized protein LOC105201574 isoform X2 [Solenopsis invicta]|uniref:uncharacterized protein LOC105201574 isoform X2 n=1 Tax=Solenopsis invicta TaxID=13686 RepID=UPI00193CCDCB|nr:uncharacterized protein LOC105201574 isoform X2 [Solenopsis invicta]XP_039315162.1 uncharacterized protein LOC105201574 isoform X2 [Solenopsis invicta]